MESTITLFSNKKGELHKFLSNFFNTNMELQNNLNWKKKYDNPIEMTELIGTFIDNYSDYDINLWISLDNNVYIKVTEKNADSLIRYIFERYPS